jgi:hypothetical protein
MARRARLRVKALFSALTIGSGLLAVAAPALATAAACPTPVVDLAPTDSGTGFTTGYKYVNHFASVPGADEAFAVGGDEEDQSSLPSVPYVQHWDGSSWSPFTAPSPSGFTVGAEALAVDALSSSDVWVAGEGTSDSNWSPFGGWVAHWGGSSWTTETLPVSAETDGLALLDIEEVASDDVWAVGWKHSSVTGDYSGVSYHYTGASWSEVSVPTGADLRLMAVDSASATDVWAVGHDAGGAITMRWNGVAWQLVSTPTTAGNTGQLLGVVARSASDVWAVGGESNNARANPVAMHWNGSAWSEHKVPSLSPNAILLDVVATTAGDLWATGGSFSASDGGWVAHYDGSAWTIVPGTSIQGLDFGYPNSIVATGDDIWTGGYSSHNDAFIDPICGLTTSVTNADGAQAPITTTDTVDADHPLRTSVDLPSTVTGNVTIRETYAKRAVSDIEMPAASAADPTVLKFFLDNSRYVGSVRPESLVLKDGVAVPACTAAGTAIPDPCVEPEVVHASSHEITVNTRHGGIWTISQAQPTASLSYTPALTMKPTVTFSDDVGNVADYTQGARNFYMTTGGVQLQADFPVCESTGGSPTDCAQFGVGSAQYTPSSPLVPGQTYRIEVNPAGEVPITDQNNVPVEGKSVTFRASRLEQETSVAAKYSWPRVSTSAAYGGSYVRSRLSGTSASWQFSGTGVRWYTVTGASMGKAVVSIDGVTKCTCDLYASSTHFHASRYFSGLADANHTIKIAPTGTKRAASADSYVAVDGFLPDSSSLYGSPSLTYQWQRLTSSLAGGGHAARFDIAGGAVSFTFKGTGIRWYTLRGPSEGKAKVYIDGVLKETYDAYAKSSSLTDRSYATSNAVHTLKLVVLGRKTAASKGTYVTVDRLTVL